uniref:Uncharacterized protein n=1 Tax=Helianthus annuus TaxID=4232 RepID=A0A251V9P6_HELAN
MISLILSSRLFPLIILTGFLIRIPTTSVLNNPVSPKLFQDCIETLDIGKTATAKSKGHNFILFVNDNPGYDFCLRLGLQQVQIIHFVELVITFFITMFFHIFFVLFDQLGFC